MRLSATLSALYSIPFVSAAIKGFDGLKGQHTGNILRNAYIVELETSANVDSFGGGNRAVGTLQKRRHHDVLYQALKERDLDFDVRTEWIDDIFTGVSISMNSDTDASEVLTMPGVVAVHPVRLYQMPKPVVSYDADNSSIPVYTPHIATGVHKLQEEGFLGEGVKVAILDTGIDYDHPVLGPQGFGPGRKVIAGYDLVGDKYNGTNKPVPDDDPMDCAGHGTHVAGIVGANINSNPYGIVGVAPSASLLAFRIFGCSGSVSDEVIIEALLKAKDAGAHVMNLSLGGSSGWNSSPTSVVASRLADLGIVMCIAAGNDGTAGPWYTSDPGSGNGVIAAASTDNTAVYFQQANVSTDHGPITYSNFDAIPVNGTWPVYVLTNDTSVTSDACDPLPDSTPDLSGHVVLIRRGNCTFVTKLANAEKKGMQVALFYNNGGAFSSIEVGNYTAALISAEDGAYLFNQFFAGNNISLTFPQEAPHEVPNPQGGGLISSFSSFGPNYDMHLNPSVAAPGGLILSSIPDEGYAVFSGTSMATPYLAGSSALVLQALGITPEVGKKIKTLFQSTASFLGSTHSDADPYDTVIKQGSGLVQVHSAIRYVTIADTAEILLNDTAHFNKDNSIGFTNTGNSSLTYKLGHTPGATAMTFNTTIAVPNTGPAPLVPSYASVEFSQSTFRLSPGESISVAVNITPPKGLNATLFPVYGGWVTATASNGEILSILYMGLAANLKDMKILDETTYYFDRLPPTILNATAEPQLGTENYTFGTLDYPSVLWRRISGTAVERIDLVPGDFNLSTAWMPDETIGTGLRKREPGSFASLPIVGNLRNDTYQPRHTADGGYDYDIYDWETNTLGNGAIVEDGYYRIMLSVLKITGDPTDIYDYDVYLSPLIGVNNHTTT